MIDFNGVQLIVENPPLAPVNKKILESVENALNIRFPEYYRDFITSIGTGEFAELNLHVNHPYQNIGDSIDEMREIFKEYWRWDESSNVLTQASAMECIPCFDNSAGTITAFHPSQPNRLFIFAYGGEHIYVVESFAELCQWFFDNFLPTPTRPFRINVFHDLETLESRLYLDILR